MNRTTTLLAVAGLALAAVPALSHAQSDDPSAGPDKSAAAAAKAATTGKTLRKPEDLKWNPDLRWINFVVNEGGVSPVRELFGAISKSELDALANGSAKGMLRVQQCFYYNTATRLFSRFDAPQPGATIALYEKNAYFRQDSIMRIIPLSQAFVENLAIRGFLNVEGE